MEVFWEGRKPSQDDQVERSWASQYAGPWMVKEGCWEEDTGWAPRLSGVQGKWKSCVYLPADHNTLAKLFSGWKVIRSVVGGRWPTAR